MENETLEKYQWSQDDFDKMGWHDNRVYAMAFNGDNYELSLDIDYICKWVKKEKSLLYWVAPATLVFRNVYDLEFSAEQLEVTILDIEKGAPTLPENAAFIEEQEEFEWIIETTGGEITFKSVGYAQYIRQKPILIKRQCLSLAERNGISFSSEAFK